MFASCVTTCSFLIVCPHKYSAHALFCVKKNVNQNDIRQKIVTYEKSQFDSLVTMHVIEVDWKSSRLRASTSLHVKTTRATVINQGRRKQSPDGQAQLDVGGEAVNNSRAKRAAKIWTFLFLAVRRRSHCTSASNWDSKAWKFSHIEPKSYACALRYVPCRILLQQFETTQMSNA